ncbi:MAG: hypothetical protein FJ189_11200, partial [Gammaproteobacteria bacterium]|nr:hypothetical protein [Gammaproteobacteria bacterium]
MRPYPDPGHRWLGVYGGGSDQYFDYFHRKLSLGDSFPDKAAWWEELRKDRSLQDGPHRHDVFIVYCGEKQGNLDVAKRRIDAWLKSEPNSPTFPELIPAICLGEENTGSSDPLLDALAHHIRTNYGIPVFQWYTDPNFASPELTADGWIWDSYGWDSVRFRKHLMKFVVLRKPAICVPWASDPHWPQWTQYPTAAALIDREWRQFEICREFNVGCAVFAVAGPHGSVNTWTGSSSPELIKLRTALRAQREAMHAIRPDELPLSSANVSARDRSVQVGGDPDAPSEYVETFSGFEWLHAADVRGFLNLRLTSRPETPGFLELMPRENGLAKASLVYRFESWFPLDHVEILLDSALTDAPAARNVLSLSTDATDESWPLEVVQDSDGIATLRLEDRQTVQGKHVFFVRLLMEHREGRAGVAANRLDRLRVRCVHQPPSPGATATLVVDDNDALSYEDDFQTKRWLHFGEASAAHPSHGGFRDGNFWVGLKGGTATSTQMFQRVSSPRPVKELKVIADGYADAPNLGGSITLSVAPRQGQPRWTITSQGRHDGPLTLVIPTPELEGLQDFDVHVTLSS